MIEAQARGKEPEMTMTQLPTDALHSVGTNVCGSSSATQALEAAGLAHWNVQKVPVWADYRGYVDDDAEKTGGRVPGAFATVRRNPATGEVEPLAIVGDRYQVVQNEEHADFLDLIVDQSGGNYETATSFRGGRLVYLSIRLPEQVYVGGVDPVEMYLNSVNSHDGSTQFMVSLDPVRAWCANQLNYFRSRAIKFRHTATLEGKVQQAREALNITFKSIDAFRHDAELLVHTDLSNYQFEKLVEEIWPVPEGHWRHPDSSAGSQDISARASNNYDRLREDLTAIYRNGTTLANVRDTAWAGLNAITEYLDWFKPVRGATDEAKLINRAERIMTDESQVKIKDKARKVFKHFATGA